MKAVMHWSEQVHCECYALSWEWGYSNLDGKYLGTISAPVVCTCDPPTDYPDKWSWSAGSSHSSGAGGTADTFAEALTALLAEATR